MKQLYKSQIGGQYAQTDRFMDNVQFFMWHGSQNLCQTMIIDGPASGYEKEYPWQHLNLSGCI